MRTVAELQAEISRLKAELLRELEAHCNTIDRAEAAEARLSALQEALQRFEQHKYPCPMGGDWIGSSSSVPKDAVCTCGLEALVSGASDGRSRQ
jgi:hypothetical protein